ncbi:type IV pilus assembly protein PilB [Aquibacillus albus]|uniref:Type IV pilus assembly protein PilB n=1 Tax=Aquibacillus albus TaxID=1168171 RepID=A0ABS2N1J5_9BACI|nr:type IV pilus assembly protein PilB [Aquibacillus albus]
MQRRKKLGDLLKESGFITEEQIEETLQKKKEGQKLGDALLDRGLITEQQLIEVLEFQLGIPSVALYRYPIDAALVKLVPKEFARKNLLIPVSQQDNTITVAMRDPMDYYAIDHLELSTGFQISPVIATKDDILQAINRYYNINDMETETIATSEEDDAPAIRIIDQLLQTGVTLKASDIHIDPNDTNILIRYRVDGILRTERAIPKDMQNSLTARVKILADLDITKTRLPQDGRIRTTIDQVPVDLRIATLPTVFGEKIVIRILDLENVLKSLLQLDFSEDNYEKYVKLIEQPSGLILLTGPTGSGKTSTLYASINHLNREEVNIMTIEDPVEYQLDGINQVQVNNSVGLSFATGLRSILRQDPNIIMVGEIRDTETAEIAIRASLTGHLVFSTLHTNSAVAAIPRLIDMDIEPYLVVSSLSAIMAQRLVKCICRDCKTARSITDMEKKLLNRHSIELNEIAYGKGCNSCQHTGYKSRMAIHELIVIDDDIRQMMMNNQSITEIRQYIRNNGLKFLVDDGLAKVKQGLTTIEEVLRVASDM